LLPERYSYDSDISGAVVSNGILVNAMLRIAGIAEAQILTATRNFGAVKFTSTELRPWLAERANLLVKMKPKEQDQAACAHIIRQLGGDIGELKFCRSANGWLTVSELASLLLQQDSVIVISDYELRRLPEFNPTIHVFPNVVGTSSGRYTVFSAGIGGTEFEPAQMRFKGRGDFDITGLVFEVAMDTWNLDLRMVSEYANSEKDGRYLPTELLYVVATTSEGREIRVGGKRIWRGMTPADLQQIEAKARVRSE
jgi:hypothetical protein